MPYNKGQFLPSHGSSESPKDKLQSCPDGLRSTGVILRYLYQISRLPVKKNRRMTEMSGYRDFPGFPYLLRLLVPVVVFDLDEFADFWVDFVISYLVR